MLCVRKYASADSRRNDTSGEDDHQTSAGTVDCTHAPDKSKWCDDEQQVRKHVGYKASAYVHDLELELSEILTDELADGNLLVKRALRGSRVLPLGQWFAHLRSYENTRGYDQNGRRLAQKSCAIITQRTMMNTAATRCRT